MRCPSRWPSGEGGARCSCTPTCPAALPSGPVTGSGPAAAHRRATPRRACSRRVRTSPRLRRRSRGGRSARRGSWWWMSPADWRGPARVSRRRASRPGGSPRMETDMTEFAAVDVIRAKRDGHALSDAQIDWVVDAYTKGVVADEQMSALAMAILLRGMTPAEIARWTAAMIASGERLDLSAVSRPTVDKHSTGGVGDKITLPLTPLVAACGAAVPQLSGRGLGHTGGTLDKLESIPGWRATLSNDEFIGQLT